MDNSGVKISIVFPSYNGEKVLFRNLKSIQKLSNLGDIELVIIDNNSTDSTKKLIKSFKNLKINLIEQNQNLGFAKACNIGVLKAKGRYVFITNQDMIFPKDFFTIVLILFKEFAKSKDIILCPLIKFLGNNGMNYFGAKIHFLGFSYTPEMYQEIPKKELTFRTLKAAGSSMFLKKELFLKLNGFDPYFFMYQEDTDFSLRALRNNIPIFTTNKTILLHQKTSFKLNDFSYYYIERNRFLCIFKNLDSLKKLIPFFLFSELILIFHTILIKKIKIRLKIYKYLIQNYKIIKKIRFNRFNCINRKVKRFELNSNLDSIIFGRSLSNNNFLNFLLKVLNLFI